MRHHIKSFFITQPVTMHLSLKKKHSSLIISINMFQADPDLIRENKNVKMFFFLKSSTHLESILKMAGERKKKASEGI